MAVLLPILQLVTSVVSVAYSVVSGLQARQDQKRAEREARDRASRRNYRAAVPARRLIYGERQVGGPFLYIDNPTKVDFVSFVGLCAHEVEGISQISLNEEELSIPSGGGQAQAITFEFLRSGETRVVSRYIYDSVPESGAFDYDSLTWTSKRTVLVNKYKNRMFIYPFLGTDSQDVGAKLTELGATNITATDTFRGIAGLVIHTYKLSEEFPEISPNWNALVKGKKVLLKSGSTGWSNNPAECARDYLENYAQSVITPEIHTESWEQAIDDCAELVTKKDGAQISRYECNGIVTSDDEVRTVLEDFQESMAGHISNAGGQWYFEAGKWKGEEVEYDVSEVTGEFEVQFEGRSSDVPNTVKGKITSAEHAWSEVEFPAQVLTIESQRIDLEIDLPMVTRHEQAQRIARIAGMRARRESGASVKLGPRGLLSRPGTVGRYTLPMMESAGSGLYEVVNFDRNLGVADGQMFYDTVHSIRETAESDYAWEPATMEIDLLQGENNLSSNDGSSPIGLAFSRVDTATVNTTLTVTWSDPSPSQKILDFVRVTGVIDSTEIIEDVSAGVETVDLIWTPDETDPATVSAKAFFTDGTNSGSTLGAEV